MVLFLSYFWFSISTLMITLFRVLTGYLFRFQFDEIPQRNNLCSPDVLPLEDDQIPELEVVDAYEGLEYDHGFDEKEEETSPEFTFKFQFQAYEDTNSSCSSGGGGGDYRASTSKFEFLPKKDFSGFMVEPEVVSFSVKELFLSSDQDYREILDDGFLSEKDFLLNDLEREVVHEELVNDSCREDLEREVVHVEIVNKSSSGEDLEKEDVHEEIMNKSCSGVDSEKQVSVVLTEVFPSEKELSINSDTNSPDNEVFDDETGFLSEDELVSSDSEPESVTLWDKFSVMINRMDENSDEFLCDEDFDSGAEPEIVVKLDGKKAELVEVLRNFEENHLESQIISEEEAVELDEGKVELLEAFQNSEEVLLESQGNSEQEAVKISNATSPIRNMKEHELTDSDEILEMIDDIEKLEELHLPNSSTLETDVQIEREIHQMIDNIEKLEERQLPNTSILDTDDHIEREFQELQAECEQEDSVIHDNFEISEESSLQDSSLSDSEDSSGLETLWEHQDLIEQLKMELKKVRATGLPTILEESESPRMSEDLKPWKIDEKFVHIDQMNGLHKLYKSYRERMRKFDILNYQKMYAIGFLQLKTPLQSMSTKKSSAPSLASVLSQNLLLPKRRMPEEDPSMMFIRDLESDLELVYIGHLCLSWEILHWEYGKAKELLESDPYEIRPYNKVAGEFQQFQVLMQRFLENEQFQGPRVQNYIKSRCVLRNLLQVPVIKEDPKDKEGRNRSKDAITCSMLVEIIEESIRTFWDFVRADKHDGNVILKGLSGPKIKLLDPANTELLADVQTTLQKKEKKLKDILRSGNCIVKRFQKHHKEPSDQLLFFSQIDLKLVSRVLKMSRITTDQLVWCRNKLNRISFVHRKIHVETSFLLFPC